MGSDCDLPVMKEAGERARRAGRHLLGAMSCRRTAARSWRASSPSGRSEAGVKVIIAGAGGAAHLPGVVAAYTPLPVIGVPITSRRPQRAGLAALHRPDALGRAGGDGGHQRRAQRGGILAAQILAIHDSELGLRVAHQKRRLAEAVVEKAKALRERTEAQSS